MHMECNVGLKIIRLHSFMGCTFNNQKLSVTMRMKCVSGHISYQNNQQHGQQLYNNDRSDIFDFEGTTGENNKKN